MRCIYSILCMLCTLYVPAQITYTYNSPRAGDIIIKQQVEYKDPGRSGYNVVWDFSQLLPVNDEYSVEYYRPPLDGDTVFVLGNERIPVREVLANDLIVSNEHYTMYYYRNKAGRLLQSGHENSVNQLSYTPYLVQMEYPMNYGQKVHSDYTGTGLYSSSIPVKTKGKVSISADAYGKMLLPTGDTLQHVLRIKTLQTIEELQDSLTEISENSIKILETTKWYSKGYRYPVFETVRDINLADSTVLFSTAFFFPPQEHLYLDTDPDNRAVLDSLWNIEHKIPKATIPEDNNTYNINLSYNFYPNPVESVLNIEYYLEKPSSVTISLYNLEGRLMKTVTKSISFSGVYTETIDCSQLSKGTYIISVATGYKMYSDKVIKK